MSSEVRRTVGDEDDEGVGYGTLRSDANAVCGQLLSSEEGIFRPKCSYASLARRLWVGGVVANQPEWALAAPTEEEPH